MEHSEHVDLQMAAGMVYHRMVRARAGVLNRSAFDEVLDRVAHALSFLAPIYERDTGAPRRVAPAELMQARFRYGARVLRRPDGTEHRRLTMRRADLQAALEALRAGAASPSPR